MNDHSSEQQGEVSYARKISKGSFSGQIIVAIAVALGAATATYFWSSDAALSIAIAIGGFLVAFGTSRWGPWYWRQ
ncbi:MAG: hypothetical protein ACR2OE_04875 [Thermomicrobiales bacterium]